MRDGYLALYIDDIPSTPDRCLSPNGHCHRMAQYRESQEARQIARIAAAEAIARRSWAKPLPKAGAIALHWTVFWGKRRKRHDFDNMVAALKSYQDGIFDQIGVNDSNLVRVHIDQHRAEDGQGYMQCAVIALDEETES